MTKLQEKTEYKQGYKKTKLGWIPEDWEVVKLGSIGNIIIGGTPDTKNINYYENGSELWASPADIGYRKYVSDTKTRLSMNGIAKIRCIPANSIMVVCIGSTIGKIALSKQSMATNQQINSIVCNKNYCHEFCYYAIELITDKIKRLASEQAVPICNKSQLSTYKILCPKFEEQQKIAKILTIWDEGIEVLERLIEKKQISKKALMQRLLTGKLRFHDFAGQKVNVVKLKDYLKESSIKNNKNQIQNVLSVTNSRGFINQDEQFERSVASKDLKGYKIVKKGQFAYNPSRINVGSIDLLKTFNTGIVSPIYVIFETKEDELLSEYLKHLFKTYNFFEQMKAFTQGGVRDSLSFKGLSMMKMFIPSIEEQKKIVAVLNSCDREIEILKQKLSKLNEQKKGLMQKLLTGQVRVKV